jgi:hypothetical protein
MPDISGQANTITYWAWNTSTNQYVNNDQANHSLKVSRDGPEIALSGAPTFLSSGRYQVALTAAENVGTMMEVGGASSTPNVVLIPKAWTNKSGVNRTNLGQSIVNSDSAAA